MEIDYTAAVANAVGATAAELRPWVQQRIGEWPHDRHGNIAPNDPAYLVSVMLDHWRPRFADALGGEGLTVVQEFRHTRNRWAHHAQFERLDAFRAIDTCRLLLRAIGSDHESTLDEAAIRMLDDANHGERTRMGGDGHGNGNVVRSGRERLRQHRKASSPAFRHEQWEQRFDRHVEPINRLVDVLIAEKGDHWMPYVAPYHGGTEAKILLLFQDPGRMTATSHSGSGFIGCENDDPSAELLADCLDEAGIEQRDVVPWNSYPWFLPDQGGVTGAMRIQGLLPLQKVIALLPLVPTVVSCGSVAHDTWQRFSRQCPRVAATVRHLETFHTSGRGITNGGQQRKVAGVTHVIETLREAAAT